ncbi:hypothetical protein [Mesorhizobium sp. CN2-181]
MRRFLGMLVIAGFVMSALAGCQNTAGQPGSVPPNCGSVGSSCSAH